MRLVAIFQFISYETGKPDAASVSDARQDDRGPQPGVRARPDLAERGRGVHGQPPAGQLPPRGQEKGGKFKMPRVESADLLGEQLSHRGGTGILGGRLRVSR